MRTNQIREIVTNKIIESMEKGVAPWNIPWLETGRACNHINNRAYRGINQIILSIVATEKGYINRWGTFRTLSNAGYKIRKGEKSTPIVFYNRIVKDDVDEDGNAIVFYVLRYSNVFSISQTENCDWVEPEREAFDPIVEAESIIDNMPNAPVIEFGHINAWYKPVQDIVGVPDREEFKSPDGFYSTIFHELGHSTGHASRLDRDGVTNIVQFGSKTYSQEELIAEFASAFLCAEAGINSTIEQNASYIAGWHKVLKNDRKMLMKAVAEGQRASDYILGATIIVDEDTE